VLNVECWVLSISTECQLGLLQICLCVVVMCCVCHTCFSVIRNFEGSLVMKYQHPDAVYGCDWSPHNAYVRVILHTKLYTSFLLFVRYVPNVAKRSIWDQCNIEDWSTDNRLTTDLCFWKNLPGKTSNGHISITVLDSRMVTIDHP